MSSALPVRTERSPAVPSAPAVAVITEPNALNKMFGSERPMALLIMRVSRVPLAPTRVPATTSTTEWSTKPLAATAKPVKELSSEMSTGTSAPPMGRTKAIPNSRASTAMTATSQSWGLTHATTPSTTIPAATTAFRICWFGIGDRASGHQLLQLGEGDGRAREGDAADDDTEDDLHDLVDGEGAGGRP